MLVPYPLQFQPIFRRYLWGGHRLATLLGKPVEDRGTCAESWEVVDHGDDQSIVTNGPLAGIRLTDLIQMDASVLFGCHVGLDRFPLLFKFLDAHRTLSVQVHPNDIQAAQLDPPDQGKTEAWVVLASDPGSKIYAGLKEGIDRRTLARELDRGTCDRCLFEFEPQPGDCVFIPAGTVHAIGEGLVIAEIQQASDTTFRLFDWNRVDANGRPRKLHIEQALDVIDYTRGPVGPVVLRTTEYKQVERLVACNSFVMDRWRFTMSKPGPGAGPVLEPANRSSVSDVSMDRRPDLPRAVGGDDRFHLLAVLEGEIELAADHQIGPLQKGATALIPAAMAPVHIAPKQSAIMLDIWLPNPS